jgi:hypothetical protein
MEKLVEDSYKDLVLKANLHYLEFYCFDFHTRCHDNSEPMIDLIKEILTANILTPS